MRWRAPGRERVAGEAGADEGRRGGDREERRLIGPALGGVDLDCGRPHRSGSAADLAAAAPALGRGRAAGPPLRVGRLRRRRRGTRRGPVAGRAATARRGRTRQARGHRRRGQRHEHDRREKRREGLRQARPNPRHDGCGYITPSLPPLTTPGRTAPEGRGAPGDSPLENGDSPRFSGAIPRRARHGSMNSAQAPCSAVRTTVRNGGSAATGAPPGP